MHRLYKVNLSLFKVKKEIEREELSEPGFATKALNPTDEGYHDLELSKDKKEDPIQNITSEDFKQVGGGVPSPVGNIIGGGVSYPSPDKFNEANFGSISEDLIRKYLNSNYSDYLDSDGYKKLENRYMENGQRAMQDTIGQLSARTGGMASSWAGTVGQEAYNRYMQDLETAAMDSYNNERAGMVNDINMALSQRDYEDKKNAESRDIATQKVLASIAAGEDPNLDDINATGMGESYWDNYVKANSAQAGDYSSIFSNAFDSDDPEAYLRNNADLTGMEAKDLYAKYQEWENIRKQATIGNESKTIKGETQYWVTTKYGTIDGVSKGIYFTADQLMNLYRQGGIEIQYDPKTNSEIYYLKAEQTN